MRRRRGLLAVTVATIAVMVAGRHCLREPVPPATPDRCRPGASRAGLPADDPSWFTVADLVDDVPTASSLAAVDARAPCRSHPSHHGPGAEDLRNGPGGGDLGHRGGAATRRPAAGQRPGPDRRDARSRGDRQRPDPGRVHPDAHRLHQGRRHLDTRPTRPDPQLRGLDVVDDVHRRAGGQRPRPVGQGPQGHDRVGRGRHRGPRVGRAASPTADPEHGRGRLQDPEGGDRRLRPR